MTKPRTIPGTQRLDVRIDGRAAYLAFAKRHGEPEEWGGRLWFRDGWSRSASDHKGPIWDPPDDPQELKAVQVRYWTQRRDFAVGLLRAAAEEARRLSLIIEANPELLDEVELESGKEVTPLQHVVRGLHTVGEGMPGAGSTVMVRRRANVTKADLAPLLTDKLERIKAAVDECDRELEELRACPRPTGSSTSTARPTTRS